MNNLININTDVTIVGSGVAGLYAALSLPSNLHVTLITKKKLEDSNSYLAQGGVCVAKNDDDIPDYIEDTLRAGKYKNDLEAVKTLIVESRENINNIIDLGVDFDKKDGKLCYTKEAAHSTNRILHVKDQTGKAIMEVLCAKIKERENISIFEDTLCANIISNNNNKCSGVIALKENSQYNIYSKVVILATGGIGGLFKNSTNKRHITADGLTIADKNKVTLKNLNYIQFHPTALYTKNSNERRLLISESVRGEGALLRNAKGERFVDELLPRDVVANAIYDELESSKEECVYLDLSTMSPEYIKDRFPYIYSECLKQGIDITKYPIPVHPVQHYFMGGIDVDLNSKTSMNNLYAIGECSCTGVHGANRLASNSLLEGLVFANRAVKNIVSIIGNIEEPSIKTDVRYSSKRNVESNFFTSGINLFKDKIGDKCNELVTY